MKKILVFVATLAILTGCKKSDDSASGEVTISLANIAGTYLATGETTTIGTNTVDTYTSSYAACERDDTYTFTSAGTFSQTDAGVKCSPTNPTISGTFSLNGNKITIPGVGTATIESLTSTKMVISYSDTISGITTKTTTTYTRQ